MPKKKSSVSRKTKAYYKKYYKKNSRDYAIRSLKRFYNLTDEQAEEVLELRKVGRCEICNKKPTGVTKGPNSVLHVDHDHNTMKIRGLLCNHCNRALGAFYDSPKLMQKATNYLNKPPGIKYPVKKTRKTSKKKSRASLLGTIFSIGGFLSGFGAFIP